MKHLVVAVCCCVFFTVQAQDFGLEHCTVLIANKKYQEALAYCEVFLKKNPNHVDALMMKGNVFWNEGFEQGRPQFIFNSDAASIFKSKMPEPVYVPASACVELTEKCWLKCLQIDSNRTDIVKGLCTMYSMALDKEKCKQWMLRLSKLEKGDGEQVFTMANYARNFIERGRFEDGMELYQYLASLFPRNAGIRADISSEYFFAGKHRECLQWADSVLKFTDIDETSYLNVAFNYSTLGYFDAALNTLNQFSQRYHTAMGSYYTALIAFAHTADVSGLQHFVASTDSNAYFKEHEVAHKLLDYHKSTGFTHYKKLIYDAEIPNYYKILVHQHGLQHWRDSCETGAMAGVFHSMMKNYPAAVQYLDELRSKDCHLLQKNDGYWILHFGYALYMNNQYAEALGVLKDAVSDNALYREAMLYFKAAALYQLRQNAEAKEIWQQLSDSATTKYNRLASEELRIKNF